MVENSLNQVDRRRVVIHTRNVISISSWQHMSKRYRLEGPLMAKDCVTHAAQDHAHSAGSPPNHNLQLNVSIASTNTRIATRQNYHIDTSDNGR